MSPCSTRLPSRSSSRTTGSDGQHGPDAPIALGEGLTSRIIAAGQPLLLNRDEHFVELGTPRLGVPAEVVSRSPDPCSATGRSARSASRAPRRPGASARPTSASCRRSPPTSERRSRTPGCTRRCGAAPTRWPPSSTSVARSPGTLVLDRVLQRIAERAMTLLDAETSAAFMREPGGDDYRRDRRPRRHRRGDHGRPDRPWARGSSATSLPGRVRVRQRRRAAIRGPPRSPGTEDVADERIMAASLVGRDGVSGVLAVWRSGPSEPFTQADLDFLVGLSASRRRSRSTTPACSAPPATPARPPSRPTRPRARSWRR